MLLLGVDRRSGRSFPKDGYPDFYLYPSPLAHSDSPPPHFKPDAFPVDRFSDLDSNLNPHLYVHFHPFPPPHSDPYLYRNFYPYPYVYSFADSHLYAFSPAYSHLHCYAYLHFYSHHSPFSNLYGHPYPDCLPYPNFHRDPFSSDTMTMSDILPFLKELLSLPGLSGYEVPVAERIEQAWTPLADEIKRTRLGSVHAFRFGTASEPRPRVLLAAHMDAIGLMVTQIVEGFLRVTAIGGVDARILPGQAVTVHGRESLPGVVVMPPPRLLPPDLREGVVPMQHLWVDIGLTPAEVQEKVQVGDLVSFATSPLELGEETLAGHSLDNRASVAALTVCLETLLGRTLPWDAIFAATVQEEETMAGALTSAFVERPTLAIAVDVTFAKGPGANDWQTFPLGKGITLPWGPNIHPAVHRRLKEIADRIEIPYSVEYTPRHSGTDAYAMQITAEGIPTAVIGIPLRYMHTPVEVASLKDIQRAGRLLAEFIASLDASFVEKLRTWA